MFENRPVPISVALLRYLLGKETEESTDYRFS